MMIPDFASRAALRRGSLVHLLEDTRLRNGFTHTGIVFAMGRTGQRCRVFWSDGRRSGAGVWELKVIAP